MRLNITTASSRPAAIPTIVISFPSWISDNSSLYGYISRNALFQSGSVIQYNLEIDFFSCILQKRRFFCNFNISDMYTRPENSPHSFLIKFLIKQKGMYYYIPILTYIVVDYSPNSPIFTTFSMFVTPFPRWLAGPPPVKTKMSSFSASPASNTISVASSNRSFVVSAL